MRTDLLGMIPFVDSISIDRSFEQPQKASSIFSPKSVDGCEALEVNCWNT